MIENLTARQQKVFWDKYLRLLAQSIRVTNPEGLEYTPPNFIWMEGWKSAIQRPGRYLSWSDRCENWYRGSKGYDTLTKKVVTDPFKHMYDVTIPIFVSLVNKALAEVPKDSSWLDTPTKTEEITKEEGNMNILKSNVATEAANVNKEAMKIAGKLTAGKTANNFFLSKLVSKLPWYAKVFGKKKELTENPIAKLVTAETAVVLAKHFAPDNAKLNYIAEAMLQDSLVDITRDSDVVEKVLEQLEEVITLPKEFMDND